MLLDFVRALDAAIEVLEEEGETHGQHGAAEQRHQEVTSGVWSSLAAWYFRGVHDADIAGLQFARNAGLFRALHQTLEDLSVRRSLAGQHSVLNALTVHRESLTFLLVEGLGQAVLLRLRREILIAHGLNYLGNFSLELRFGDLHRRSHLQDVRVFVPELFAQLDKLALQTREVRFLLLNEGIRKDSRECIEGGSIRLNGLNLSIERFLFDSFGLSASDRGIQVRELLNHDILSIVECDGVILLAVPLQRLLARIHLLALFRELLAEPVGRLLRREELEFEVLLDIGTSQRIAHFGRHYWVRRVVPGVHEAAVAD